VIEDPTLTPAAVIMPIRQDESIARPMRSGPRTCCKGCDGPVEPTSSSGRILNQPANEARHVESIKDDDSRCGPHRFGSRRVRVQIPNTRYIRCPIPNVATRSPPPSW
jgi:hypothetical protein